MAAEIRERFELAAQLVPGSGGVFEVQLDDRTIFSKSATGRFPIPGEVEQAIERRLSA